MIADRGRRLAGAARNAIDESTRRHRWARESLAAIRREQRFGASLLAGGLAYRFFLWLVPFGLVVAAVASFWVDLSPAGLQQTARSFGLGGVAARSAAHAIESGSRARWYLLGFGLVLTAWAGIGGARALRAAARVAWETDPAGALRPARASAAFTAIGILGLGVSMLAAWARHHSPAAGLVVTVADIALFGLLALWVFLQLPRPEETSWRDHWLGAALVGAGLTGVQLFLAYYLASRLERAPHLYGTLGAATVVMLVLFLIARLLVAAMFLNATIWRSGHPEA